jgi:hypothetical protein
MARASAKMTLGQLAAEVSAVLDTQLSREIVRRVELGDRDAEVRLIWAVAQVTGESFDWLTEPLNKLRDLNEAIPGYDNPVTLRDRISRRILKSDHSQRFHCFDCLLDPDFHVLAEWLEPAGVLPQVPGQTEFIINIEKMLEEVA